MPGIESVMYPKRLVRQVAVTFHALNGNNGSWTNSDDVNPNKKKGNKNKQKKKVLVGNGAYTARQIGEIAGKMLAKTYGLPESATADMAGNVAKKSAAAFRKFRRFVGRGDYDVSNSDSIKYNSLMKGTNITPDLSFSTSKGSITITHREYIGSIKTGTTAGLFSSQTYDMNCSSNLTFPWLSNFSQQYEIFNIHGLVFETKSMSSNYASGTAVGSYFITALYNPTAMPYSSKVAMENSEEAISGRLDQSLVYGVECDPTQRVVRNLYTATNTTQDKALVSLGTLQVGVQPAATVPTECEIAELWVTYHVSFARPRYNRQREGFYYYAGTGCSAFTCFGGTEVNSVGTGALSKTETTGTLMTFKGLSEGDFILVSRYYQGTVAGTFAYTNPTTTGLEPWKPFNGAVWGKLAPSVGAATTAIQMDFGFKVVAPNPTLRYSTNDVLPTGTCSTDIYVMFLGTDIPSSSIGPGPFTLPRVAGGYEEEDFCDEDEDSDETTKVMPQPQQGSFVDAAVVESLSREELELIETMRRAKLNAHGERT